jgi:hypothetical protein
MAKTPVVFQASGTGPNAFIFVNPKDEPRHKSSMTIVLSN